MSALNPALSSAAQARAEYEKATQGLLFTKDFTSLDAIIQDRLATAGERVYAWIKRRAWGNYRLFCVNEDGTPAYQCDCVAETGILKQIVSRTVQYLEKRGYVRTEGKLIYPVLSPVLGEASKKVTRSVDFLQFIDDWKVTHSVDFEELEVARSNVERIRKVILSGYKQWLASRTNGGPTLIESKRVIERKNDPPPHPVLSATERADDDEAPPLTPEVLPAIRADFATFKALYPKTRFDEGKAKPIFEGLKPEQKARVIAQLARYKESARWQDQAGRWIPFASNWLPVYEADPPDAFRPANGKVDKMKSEMELTQAALQYLKTGGAQ